MQSDLWATGYQTATGAVDHNFGSKTRQAVIHFQNKYRLGADGIVGPKTWRKFEEFTYNVGTRYRVYRHSGSSTYEVTYTFSAAGNNRTSYEYYLENIKTGKLISYGTIWVH